MFDFLTSDVFERYPVLQFTVAVAIIAAMGLIWLRGERAKRNKVVDDSNTPVSKLDLARFEATLELRASDGRKPLYEKLDNMNGRLSTVEAQLTILLSRRK